MKYFTFQHRFHPLLLSGAKHSTIRLTPKVRPGERFALRYWTGRPYGAPMGILATAVCRTVDPIRIGLGFDRWEVEQAGRQLTAPELDELHQSEGFPSHTDLLAWFRDHHGLPCDGWRTTWNPSSLEIARAA